MLELEVMSTSCFVNIKIEPKEYNQRYLLVELQHLWVLTKDSEILCKSGEKTENVLKHLNTSA